MRRMLAILALVLTGSLFHAAEVLAGASAGTLYVSFTGPALSATVVLNSDSVTDPGSCSVTGAACPSQGTVAIRLTKGHVSSGAVFADAYVAGFANGCDGTLGATTESGEGVVAKTDARFLGVGGWIPTSVLTSLLAPFELNVDPSNLAFSDISNPVCTQVGGVYILSFTGTMQFGKKQ